MTFAAKLALCAALASPTALAGAARAAPAMFRGGPALTGVYDAPSPHSLQGVRFSFATGGPIRTTPAVADGVLYLAGSDHLLYALDAQTGRERWRFDGGAVLAASPAVAGGLVFVTNRSGRLFALSTANGSVKWTADLGADLGISNYWDFYMSSPSLAGAALYIGSGDGHVLAFDRRSGRRLWAYDAGSRMRATPAVTDDAVVFATLDGHVIALERANGALRWTFATRGASNKFTDLNNDTTAVIDSPSISDGVVVIGGRDAYAYGLDLKTGRKLWEETHDGGSWILSNAVRDGVAYIGSGSAAVLQAVDLATGRERWRFKITGSIFGSPSIAGDTVMVSDFAGNLYGLDLGGQELWRFPLGGRGLSTPVAAGNIVYAGSDDGVLYALDTSTRAAAAPADAKRYVFWEAGRDDDAFGYLQNNIDRALLGYFQAAGYAAVDAGKLKAAMQAQIDGGGHSVIVFAADRLPPGLVEAGDARALLRRYLDAGGHIVFLGPNPARFKYAKDTGALVDVEGGPAAAMLGIDFPPAENERGYHVSTPTSEGRRWGLRGQYVANGAIDPSQVTTVLAANEFGLATSWVKAYGDRGGSLIQLCAPSLYIGSLSEIHIAAEHSLL